MFTPTQVLDPETETTAQESMPFDQLDDYLFPKSGTKTRLTRRQKRQLKLQHIRKATTHTLDLFTEELQDLQANNPSLESAQKIARGLPGPAGSNFFYPK